VTPVNLILIILGIAEPILAKSGVIPSEFQGLISGILNAITAVKAEISGNNGQLNINAVTLLQAISAGAQALSGVLPTGVAGITVVLDNAASRGIAAYQQAQTKVDPAQLQPIAPVA
jgi:hypothetical protein